MPIPEYNALKVPLLEYFSDGIHHKTADAIEALAKGHNLSQEELKELLPSGIQTRWQNRVKWALYDLFRAGLLERQRKGIYAITELGRKVLSQKPKYIDRTYLMQFPGFVEFIQASGVDKKEGDDQKPEDAALPQSTTPEETIGLAYQAVHAALKKEVLDLVKKMDPFRFEQLVVDLLVAMGYGGSREEAAQVTRPTNDEGIDGIINEDRLGLDVIYLQAKRWQNSVGRKEIQSFVGALAGQKANKGVFITTSTFSNTAIDYARNIQHKVILIDGDRLADLMIQHNIGVSISQSYVLKHVDSDYFEST